ncbi:LytTR family transcriptional regulator DNA-binding domain-containing protein [Sporosarcina sp. Marseille-Q4063]|uniref:LytTR family DNA-binding domain-containing protein n=1 Tax=Sporosarcina sp. Marseille-Q4063 TaxID=2810514 RepID=UPI001BB0024D|nr:LytTR family DNA-binding domain-containing protein [Sporosarcina sp. Marseille-Q4063]QUW20442.1 LytTR family transcriptional regulator DNA-binding domain-containing protein [Sporosarcina sp. Marseille-Q4063]
MTNEGLQQLVSLMKDWIPDEAAIAVATDNAYSQYISGAHDIRIQKGQMIEKGSVAETVIKKKCKVEKLVDDSIFGVPYYGIGYPIQIEEKEGALIIILPTTHPYSKQQTLTFLTGRNENIWCPIEIKDVSHIESLQKKTWFYTNNEGYQSIYTLKDLTFQLPTNFIRIHRSYIVNISYIMEISRDFSSNIQITIKDGTVLPVSQTYSADVRKKLGF